MKMMIGLFEGKIHVKFGVRFGGCFGTLSFKCKMYEMHKRCALMCDFECLLIKFGMKLVMEH